MQKHLRTKKKIHFGSVASPNLDCQLLNVVPDSDLKNSNPDPDSLKSHSGSRLPKITIHFPQSGSGTLIKKDLPQSQELPAVL